MFDIGDKITIRWDPEYEGQKTGVYLRGYVIKVVPKRFLQVYDPKRDYSWGVDLQDAKRVVWELGRCPF